MFCGNLEDIDVFVDLVKGEYFDEIFLRCFLVFLEIFLVLVNECVIIFVVYCFFIGNRKFLNKEMFLKVFIFLGVLFLLMDN